MLSTISDTVFTVDGGATTWKAIYTILKNEKPEVVEVKATADDARPSIYILNMPHAPSFTE